MRVCPGAMALGQALFPRRRELGSPFQSQDGPALAAGALRPWVYFCLSGLLSVSGMRLGETRNLELQDVIKTGVLTIRGAKFGNTRRVSLHSSTRQSSVTTSPDEIVRR